MSGADRTQAPCDWILKGTGTTGICVVVDDRIPSEAVGALVGRCGDTPGIAVLRIADPVSAHRAWCESTIREVLRGQPVASALQIMPRSVRLLIWSGNVEELDWIGGVEGQRVLLMRYWNDIGRALQVERMVERVLAVLRLFIQENQTSGY
ncbi:hypothetical protein [Paraburkholderia silvatlantica]|uniref:Uncharacterized protein n=1 Tax=Paraburkholderia silvatlantica TaxID=321895 RepID=A0A2U1A9H0_9BURK|nr:hypothetical protein [Paraburkholderia silvatlantica]MBB2930509.1 hypothetical protein [Paraburkholderia silvatlantica]PVY30316.1 hypothetical protein C7411_11370 [Paraburkholderia silvatlantica]PXW36948.1 hypothetical protein C7413_113141 [Paraburkholderia silvatlantica]PYE21287.1 hypothetical protein C7410_115130 [Paraburkholderia silvatlantica]TDQ86572.1 hypothetical protein C7412_11767 [Paraburkholderia silvatlantica]